MKSNEGDTMKNIELYKQMKSELDGYQFGLHNISVSKYKSAINLTIGIRDNLDFTGAEISEKSIADNIVRTGLNIVDRAMGLRSTVMPVKEFNEDSFDYTYNDWEEGTIWNVIVAIPRFIKYQGKEYFIGDINEWISICNMLMFKSNIAREFIYGYYSKEITEKHLEPIGKGSNSFNISHTFSDELEFSSNPYFFEYLNNSDRSLVLRRMFDNDRRLLRNLKLANNSKLGMAFRTSYEKFVIKNTREQVKRLTYCGK